jgi:hypothetical protein
MFSTPRSRHIMWTGWIIRTATSLNESTLGASAPTQMTP